MAPRWLPTSQLLKGKLQQKPRLSLLGADGVISLVPNRMHCFDGPGHPPARSGILDPNLMDRERERATFSKKNSA